MRGPLQRALARPWCRAFAITGAYVLAVQSLRLPLLATAQPESCCCGRGSTDASCPCRVCTHAREVQSGAPRLKTCGPTGESAAVPVADPAFPAPQRLVAPRLVLSRVEPRIAWRAPERVIEVPTPPPLART